MHLIVTLLHAERGSGEPTLKATCLVVARGEIKCRLEYSLTPEDPERQRSPSSLLMPTPPHSPTRQHFLTMSLGGSFGRGGSIA